MAIMLKSSEDDFSSGGWGIKRHGLELLSNLIIFVQANVLYTIVRESSHPVCKEVKIARVSKRRAYSALGYLSDT